MNQKDMLKKFEFIVNTSQEFMTMINRDYVYVAANQAYCKAHKRKNKDVVGATIDDVWGEATAVIIKGYLHEAFSGREVHYESWFDFPALGKRCFEVYSYPFVEEGETTHIVVISRDITERKLLEEKAFVDPLTGLYNYRYLNQRLDEEFERAKRYNLNLSALFVDIDNFKEFNDKMGHQAGNDILINMSKILCNSTLSSLGNSPQLRKADIIARFGGEEFIILLPETNKADSEIIAERIRNTIALYNFPHYEERSDVRVTISVGIASYPVDAAENPGDLLKKADLAMYEAKNKGKNRVCSF